MKQQIIQHPSGVHFYVEYIPRTTHSKPRVNDVRLAGADYEPLGPNLAQFLHNTYTVLQDVATPVLEDIMQAVESHE